MLGLFTFVELCQASREEDARILHGALVTMIRRLKAVRIRDAVGAE